MPRLLRIWIVLSLLLSLVPVRTVTAAAHDDPETVALINGLRTFARLLENLDAFDELGTPVPVTPLSFSSDELFNLDRLFAESLGNQLRTVVRSSPEDLAAAVAGFGGDYHGVDVTYTASTEKAGDLLDFTVHMTATRSVTVPVSIGSDNLVLAGGGLPLDLSLRTTLDFQLDTLEPNPRLALYLKSQPAPTFLFAARSAGQFTPFNHQIGFADISVSGSASLDVQASATFLDPDGNGRLTQEEWEETALVDLVDVGYLDDPDTDAVRATFNLDSDLVDASPVETITLRDGDLLSDGFNPGPLRLTVLDKFQNISADDVLSGLAQFTAALVAAQASRDPKLPFLQEHLSEAMLIAQPLIDVVQQQGDAAIVCGAEDTSPPRGSLEGLGVGDPFYCQAFALDAAASVSWTSPQAEPVPPSSAMTTTVGLNPTRNAEFHLLTSGKPQVQVQFTDVQGGEHRVESRFQTAQELAAKLLEIGQFDTVEVGYSPADTVLTFRLVAEPEAVTESVHLDFGDKLQEFTNLTGLKPVGAAGATLQLDQVRLDITFGVLLSDEIPTIATLNVAGDAGNGDNGDDDVDGRFFIQVNPDRPEMQADVRVTGDVELTGQVGFMKIAARGNGDQNMAAPGVAFHVGRSDPGTPVLALDLEPSGPRVPIPGTNQFLENAIPLRAILDNNSDITRFINARCNGSMSAGLDLTATVGDTVLPGGGVAITWEDAFTDECLPDVDRLQVASVGDLADTIKSFDVQPSLFGTNEATTPDVTTMRDATVDFLGMGRDLTGATLRNKTDGSRCVITAVTAGSVTCENGLEGGQDNRWEKGDKYEISGDPLVMLRVILDNLDQVAGLLDSLTGDENGGNVGPLTTDLPLIGLSAQDLVGQFTALHRVIKDLRSSGEVPTTLQGLTEFLNAELQIGDAAWQLDLADLPKAGSGITVPHLVLRLGYGICTQEDGNPNQIIGDCAPASAPVDKFKARLNLDLADKLDLDAGLPLSGLVGVNADAGVDLEYAALAQMDLAISLESTPSVSVLSSSGVTVTGGVSSTVNLSANLGPIVVQTGGPAQLGVSFAMRNPSSTPQAIDDFVGGLKAELTGPGNPLNCGQVGDTALGGAACARLALELPPGCGSGGPLGELGFQAADLKDTSTFSVTVSSDMKDKMSASISDCDLDWRLLYGALPELMLTVEDNLDGASSNTSVPLIGESLDAGAGVVQTARTQVVEPLQAELEPMIAVLDAVSNTTTSQITGTVALSITAALGANAPLLGPVRVRAYCGDVECPSDESATAIDDLRVTFTIGQIVTHTLPFDIGVPGVPMRTQGSAMAQADWHLVVDFGINRFIGPYLVTHDTLDPTEPERGLDVPELGVSARVSVAEAQPGAQAECQANDPLTDPSDPLLVALPNAAFSSARCLSGSLGFLQVTLRDNESNPTGVQLQTGINLMDAVAAPGIGRIGFKDLTAKAASIELGLQADANVDLRFRTGVAEADTGFPSVLGTFQLSYGKALGAGEDVALDVSFANLYLDTGAFMSKFVQPIAGDIKNVTSPFMPVIDTVQTPLPVLSDLSKMTGGGDISLLNLLETSARKDLTMIRRLVEFVHFANSIPESTGQTQSVWIPLGPNGLGGAFKLDSAKALAKAELPGKRGALIKRNDPSLKVQKSSELKKSIGANRDVPKGMFGVGGLTFPFIQEPTQIFGLLMGEDATLIHYNAGTMTAQATVRYKYRFIVGPVLLSLTLAGSTGVQGRFAMGYDTAGLRQVLDGASAGKLLDGIFIDDYDANGNDVAELRLFGTITARAGLDLVVVSAGVGGGIDLTIDFNLNDPNQDGKLRIAEISAFLHNPWCLFDVSGRLSAFLEAFVELDLFFYVKTYTFEMARVSLMDFSAACDPTPPKLAAVDMDMNGDGTPDLLLNIGPHAGARGSSSGESNEALVVRQLNLAGTRVSVAGFGVQLVYDLTAGAIVWADGGDGNDNIALEAGVDEESGATVAFTLRAVLYGGPGDDQLKGGDGADQLYGEDGDDRLAGGDGMDILFGGAGNDALSGGLGDDTVCGNDGDDRINGDPGGDNLFGGDGADVLDGGPMGKNATGAAMDLADQLYGGSADDTLWGGFGADVLYGDQPPSGVATSCDQYTASDSGLVNAADGGVPGDDTLNGGPDADWLFGDAGNDRLFGNEGSDVLLGQAGHDLLDGGADSDELSGGPSPDDLIGGPGQDWLWGDAGDDILLGDSGVIGDHLASNHFGDASAVLRLVSPIDEPAVGRVDCDQVGGTSDGNGDCLFGGDGNDFLFGEGGHDYLFGEIGDDFMDGNAGEDIAFGDVGDDTVRGGPGDDLLYGNSGNDSLFGDAGADEMFGQAGDDLMRGGQDADTMFGNAGDDTMHGDSGNDTMYGDDRDIDTAPGDDLLRGGIGDDYLEGNRGNDELHGDAGQDDLIGGGPIPRVPDGADRLFGEGGFDVLAGDNAQITRPVDAAGDLILDSFSPAVTGLVRRNIVLLDVEPAPAPAFSVYLRGDDFLDGGAERDFLFGQGGDDELHGNLGNDYLEGNGGADRLFGDAGQDDLLGGNSTRDGRFGSPSRPVNMADGDDWLNGGEGDDLLLGDNGVIRRPRDRYGRWRTANNVTVRDVYLLPQQPGAAYGDDHLVGDQGDDVLLGSDGDDYLEGSSGDDFLAGNRGNDYLEGNNGQDRLLGDAGEDVLAGNNAGDCLVGGPGNDGLFGWDGPDSLTGGGGQNQFNSGRGPRPPGGTACPLPGYVNFSSQGQ